MKTDARTALLDAAERLFGAHGIASVSDRKVAEAAGNTNHSAVGYHFGGRDGLLAALAARHLDSLEARRAELFAGSTSLEGDLHALVAPVVELLASLPTPSWRARYLQQALAAPDLIGHDTWPDSDSAARAIVASIGQRLSHMDAGVIEARGRVMARLVVAACAEIEGRPDADAEMWHSTGIFLAETITGMLAAPTTQSFPVQSVQAARFLSPAKPTKR